MNNIKLSNAFEEEDIRTLEKRLGVKFEVILKILNSIYISCCSDFCISYCCEENENSIFVNNISDINKNINGSNNNIKTNFSDMCNDFSELLDEFIEKSSFESNNKKEYIFNNYDKTDNVNHPYHYKSGKYECIDVMEDVFGKEYVSIWCLLNAFKYLWRTENKNKDEDIEKSIWYLKKKLGLNKNKE